MRRSLHLGSGPGWHQEETKHERIGLGISIREIRAMLRAGRCEDAIHEINAAHIVLGRYITQADSTKRPAFQKLAKKGKAGVARKLRQLTDAAVACLTKPKPW